MWHTVRVHGVLKYIAAPECTRRTLQYSTGFGAVS